MQLVKGTELKRGDYQIIEVLGQGGFGITYLARQTALGRKVAIKEFFMKEHCNRESDSKSVSVPSTGSKGLVEYFKKKFLKEALLIASFNNARIIRIYDVFEENGTAYYVMEYLEGESLKEVVDNNGALPEDVAVKYIRQAAEALSAVHAHNLLHLDVKPANIMLDENCNAVLIDFGVSKHYDEEGGQTSSGLTGLSEGYAPLEQYETGLLKEFTPAPDIYALGATLFFLLTGTRPPKASIVNDSGLPPMPTAISAPVRKAVEKAMQPRRKDRPQSIEEFVELLDAPKPKLSTRKFPWILVLLLLAVGAVAGGFMLFGGGNDAEFADTSVKRTEEIALKSDTANKENDKLVKKENKEEENMQSVPMESEWGNETAYENGKEGYEEEGVNTAFATAAINGHEYVDLGLPSGVKWATCNVGASKPEEYGNYYAWGETSTKEDYSSGNSVTYGKKLNDIGGNPAYDVARKQWGSTWRLPTKAEFDELLRNCTRTWTTQNGIKGYKVTSKKNGNSIFLPAAGWRDGTSLFHQGTYGFYWSSTPPEIYSDCAYRLDFDSGGRRTNLGYRNLGQSVRPVSGGNERNNVQENSEVGKKLKRYKIGDYYKDGRKEGVVFYVSDDGKHGKIISLVEAKKLWATDAVRLTTTGSLSKNDGKLNMSKIKEEPNWSNNYPAFAWCNSLGDGWYLPSLNELRLVYDNEGVINDALHKLGKAKLKEYYYWSSTGDTGSYRGSAYYVHFDYGYGDDDYVYKNYNFYVRAVSDF